MKNVTLVVRKDKFIANVVFAPLYGKATLIRDIMADTIMAHLLSRFQPSLIGP